jgi:cytochrome c553
MAPSSALRIRSSAAAALLAASFAASAQSPGTVKLCESCHGPGGNSVTAKVPSIAAQPQTFLENQLVYFREELRPAPVMQAIAKGLKDEDITALAKHFAASKAEPALTDAVPAATADGARSLATKLHCGQCHLPDFRGQGQMARLAGQREDYLIDALVGYRDGHRGGADTTMAEVLYGVGDDDLRMLAAYLSRLK